MSKFFKSLLLLLSAGLFTATGWAELVAEWNDFTAADLTQGDYTLNLNGNTVENGVVTIDQDMGPKVTCQSTSIWTIVLDIENAPSTSMILDAKVKNNSYNYIGLYSNESNLKSTWTNNLGYGKSKEGWEPSSRHTLTMTYSYSKDVDNNSQGTTSYQGTTVYLDGTACSNHNALRTNADLTSFTIGYTEQTGGKIPSAKGIATGMKVYRIRLYNHQLGDSDVQAVHSEMTPSTDTTLTPEIIAINFANDKAPLGDSTASDDAIGFEKKVDGVTYGGKVVPALWTKTTGGVNNEGDNAVSTLENSYRLKWSSKENNYQYGKTDTLIEKLTYGYLDNDASTQNHIELSGLPVTGYDVAVILAGDGGKFSSVKVNGRNYTYVDGVLTLGNTAWGTRAGASALIEGTNVMFVPNQIAHTLTIDTFHGGNTGGRGTIAALMVFFKSKELAGAEISGSEAWNFVDEDDVDIKTVTVTEKSFPASITVENTNTQYVITGEEISGSASLTKKGAGLLYMDGKNSFTGGVTIEGGTLVESGYYTSSNGGNKMGSGKASAWASKLTLKNGVFDLNNAQNYKNGTGSIWGWLSTETLTLGGVANGIMEIKNGVFGIGASTSLKYDATNNPGTATISAHYVFTGTSTNVERIFDIENSTATDTEVNFTGGLHANTDDAGKQTTIVKSGPGTMQISSQYGFKGLKMTEGKVRMGYADAFLSGNQGNFATLTFNGGELDLAGFSQRVPAIAISANSKLTSMGNSATLTTATLTGTNTLTLGSNATLAYAGGETPASFAGKFSSEGTLSAGTLEVVSGNLTLTTKGQNHQKTKVLGDATLVVNTSDSTWNDPSFKHTDEQGHAIIVEDDATLELGAGHAYMQVTGDGTTKVIGGFHLGFGGAGQDAIQTAKLNVAETGTLHCRPWTVARAITSSTLVVDGVIQTDEGNSSVSCNAVKNLSGAGTIGIPVTLLDRAVIDATTTVKGDKILAISELTLPASGAVTVKVATLSESPTNIILTAQAPANIDTVTVNVECDGRLYRGYTLAYSKEENADQGVITLEKNSDVVLLVAATTSPTSVSTVPEKIIIDTATFGYGKHIVLQYTGEGTPDWSQMQVEGLPAGVTEDDIVIDEVNKTWGFDNNRLNVLPIGDSITAGLITYNGSSANWHVPGGYRLPLYQFLTQAGYEVNYLGTSNYTEAETGDAAHNSQEKNFAFGFGVDSEGKPISAHHDGHSGATLNGGSVNMLY